MIECACGYKAKSKWDLCLHLVMLGCYDENLIYAGGKR